MLNSSNKLAIIMLLLLCSACATTDYTTHYGIFEAENSAGEQRLFRLYWQTVRYEGWLKNEYRALPLVLESQCSERRLRFYDNSFGDSLRCVGAPQGGISFCGQTRLDESRRGEAIEDRSRCGLVTDRNGVTTLLELNGEVLLTLDCRPKETQRQVGRKIKNIDYLLGSAIPYIVSTKAVRGKDIAEILPEVSSHSSICDPN